MSFEINDHLFHRECVSLAKDIVEQCENLDEVDEAIWEWIDGHEWVICNYKALMICAHCNVDEGEAFLEDIGMPDDPTIYKLASTIVYGEMRHRVREECEVLFEDDAA